MSNKIEGIYLDFDGTVVEHEYPRIGRKVPGAFRVISMLLRKGYPVFLNTMRVEECYGGTLQKALSFINLQLEDDLTLTGCTPKKLFAPRWKDFSSGWVYIDDQALGMPLIPAVMTSGKVVDWNQVAIDLIDTGVLIKENYNPIDFLQRI